MQLLLPSLHVYCEHQVPYLVVFIPRTLFTMLCANFTKDEEFVEMFKKEHNEQFYVLVKMHLSFLLDMTTEE